MGLGINKEVGGAGEGKHLSDAFGMLEGERGKNMAFCKNCGVEINEGTTFCPNCGTKQDNVGVTNEAQPQPQYTAQPQVVDNGGFGWGLLGCCIPIVGLVLFLVWKDNKPNTAKAAGVGAIVGVVLCVIYYLIVTCLGVGAVMYGGF